MSTTFRIVGVIRCLPALLFAHSAAAGPEDGVVRAGAASVSRTGATTTISQTSNRAVIDWRSFSTAPGESVKFLQPDAQSAVLNRVTGSQMSSLQGALTANGQVFLVNPNGILIGNGASIDVGSFVASTANIANAAFMRIDSNGHYAFNELARNAGTATIENAGSIAVADGGLVALVAPGVRNSGTITARLGTIELASATHFTLDLFGDDLVRLAVGDSVAPSLQAQVDAGGQLTADGGRIVLLSVPAAAGVVGDAINLSGIARASSLGVNQRGEISLLANQGVVRVSGNTDVSSSTPGVQGGEVSVLGGSVLLSGTARVNASGVGGGGYVVLGGNFAGEGATITQQTTVQQGALVTACGTAACAPDGTGGDGDGGEIRLFSAQATELGGELNVSSSSVHRAGVVEVVSDAGLTKFTSQARIVGITGEGQAAGFTAILGNTLDLAPTSFIDMSDVAGNLPSGSNRLISDSRPGTTTRSYVSDPGLETRQTDQPIVIHAYVNNGVSTYPDHLPTIRAAGVETPVGTLRPNGGAPTTFAASGADTLAAIPVTFSPPAPAGSDAVNTQVADAANTLTRDAADRQAIVDAGIKAANGPSEGDSPMMIVIGGPGVARVADLGRAGAEAGASPDVFGVNFHVLAPVGGDDDAPISDYLCRTPYASDACK